VTRYVRTDKREIQILGKSKKFSVGQKTKKYQQNYLKHILRTQSYQIAWKTYDYHPNG
jgi:hypothetical protein